MSRASAALTLVLAVVFVAPFDAQRAVQRPALPGAGR